MKRRSAPLYGPYGSGRTLRFYALVSLVTSASAVLNHYAGVLISRITQLARPSVCPSIRLVRDPNSKNEKTEKKTKKNGLPILTFEVSKCI